jgi:flagellar hook-associated protein 2
VSIQNGRLVIQTTSSGTLGTTTRRESIMHNNGTNEDVLPFTPNANPPISGRFSISQGSTVFQEGVDYRIETRSDVEHGTVENRVVGFPSNPLASAATR